MDQALVLSQVHPRSLSDLPRYLEHLVAGRLWLKVLIAMGLGIGVGLLLGPSVGWVDPQWATLAGEWLALPGQLFLGSIQMIVVPLVVASIIRGLAAGEDVEQLRRLGLRLTGYFVASTTVAVTIGIGITYALRPGRFIVAENLFQIPNAAEVGQSADPSSIPELVTSTLPTNPLGAMVEGQMLQVVLFSVIFGVALIAMKPAQAEPILDLLGSLQEVCMTVVRWAMRLAPIAVFGLVARVGMTLGVSALTGLAAYIGTVLLGLLILLVLYTTLSAVVGRKSPRKFLRSIRDVQLLAFSTSSSAAVMPLSITTAQEELQVRPSVAQLVVPLGATINMDGTAMYQSIATVFLAQVTGIDLSVGALVLIVITAVGASIGASSTPGVGIVLLASVLRSAGIPVEAIALIIGVDRILDMTRTAVNVTGDLTACVVMDRWVGGPLTGAEETTAQSEHEAHRAASDEDAILSD